MDFGALFRRKPKMLDAAAQAGEGQEAGDPSLSHSAASAIAANEVVRRRQQILLASAGGVVLVAGLLYIFAPSDEAGSGNVEDAAKTVSVDEMVNRNMAEKEWRAQSEAQMASMDNNMRALAARAERADQLEQQLGSGQGTTGSGDSVSADTQRILTAYQSENEQLRAALDAARQSPVAASTPARSLYGRTASALDGPGMTPAGEAAAQAAGLTPTRRNEVSLVAFGEGSGATGSPVPKGSTVYTDSANYLPPNSIAVARVIVGVDANAGVQSQTDPLPVVLRITGPARSVYDKGRLLTTNIAGCLVNGAARGDLSSEKVYVKLQRMTCPQPGGRFAVADVKGFIAFGGKTGVRGRVVSREGALVGQAFLAGLAGGFGRGFSANSTSLLTGGNINVGGQRQKLKAGEILEGGLGEGVATSADTVSKYLIERAEQYQPVIEMPTGIDVEIVFLEGVFING